MPAVDGDQAATGRDPAGHNLGGDELDEEALAAFYRHPDPGDGRSWVRTSFITTLDGAAEGPDHLSASISSAADRRVLAMLRAQADLILVGAGTARDEGYAPIRIRTEHAPFRERLGMAATPPTAIVTSSLDVPEKLLTDPRTIVLTTDAADPHLRQRLAEQVDVAIVGDQRADPAMVLQALRERGHRRILCEGGPKLLAEYVAAGMVDELCLSWSPLLRGGRALPIIDGPDLPSPMRFRLAGLLEDDSFLFGRWIRR